VMDPSGARGSMDLGGPSGSIAEKELYKQGSLLSYLSFTLNSIDYLLLSSNRIIIH
jgi:hypothetical protein